MSTARIKELRLALLLSCLSLGNLKLLLALHDACKSSHRLRKDVPLRGLLTRIYKQCGVSNAEHHVQRIELSSARAKEIFRSSDLEAKSYLAENPNQRYPLDL